MFTPASRRIVESQNYSNRAQDVKSNRILFVFIDLLSQTDAVIV
jgi:hypothetical protein